MFPIKIVHVPIRTTNVHHVGLLKNISFLLVKKKKTNIVKIERSTIKSEKSRCPLAKIKMGNNPDLFKISAICCQGPRIRNETQTEHLGIKKFIKRILRSRLDSHTLPPAQLIILRQIRI